MADTRRVVGYSTVYAMLIAMTLLFVRGCVGLVYGSEGAFTIRVLDEKGKAKTIGFPGAAFTVECHVPIQPNNRKLDIGVEGLGYSTMDINGVDGPTVFRREYRHADCTSNEAFCQVRRNDGSGARIQATIMIANCDGGHQ